MNLKFITLIHKNKTNQSTTEEDQQLQDWKQEDISHQSCSDDLSNIWDASAEQTPSFQPNVEAGLVRLKTRIQEEERGESNVRELPKRSNTWMRVAAAVLALIVAGFVGTKVLSTSLEMLIVQTTTGETKVVELADGSVITVNEESSFSYPKAFDKGTRHVELSGEAFFDIVRNPDQPFTITTTHTEITVLGTSFNVRSEIDESTTEVNVATGKVQLTSNKTNESLVLIKGEEGRYNHRSQTLNKVNNPSTNAMSWINHQLTFNKTPLATVVRDLEHYFDVHIHIENTQLQQCKYTSLFNTPELLDILELLTTAFDMELEQAQKHTYQLKGGRCN